MPRPEFQITQELREKATSPERALIADLKSGEVKCHDPEKWIAEKESYIKKILSGSEDSNFTVWQRMCYHATGECPAFLP